MFPLRLAMMQLVLPEVSRWQHSREGVSVMKHSPDGTKLAVGTKDSFIDMCVSRRGS